MSWNEFLSRNRVYYNQTFHKFIHFIENDSTFVLELLEKHRFQNKSKMNNKLHFVYISDAIFGDLLQTKCSCSGWKSQAHINGDCSCWKDSFSHLLWFFQHILGTWAMLQRSNTIDRCMILLNSLLFTHLLRFVLYYFALNIS